MRKEMVVEEGGGGKESFECWKERMTKEGGGDGGGKGS